MRFKKNIEKPKSTADERVLMGNAELNVADDKVARSVDLEKERASASPRLAGRFAYDGLERLLHERARLSILSSLSAHAAGLLFNDLKSLCALTDGNLSRQLQTLQEAGLVEMWKSHRGSRPQTLCRLTAAGQQRFLEYVNVLEGVVADALTQTSPTRRSAPARAVRPSPQG